MAKEVPNPANSASPSPIQTQPDRSCGCDNGIGVGEVERVGRVSWGVNVAVARVVKVAVGGTGVVVLRNTVAVALGVTDVSGALVGVDNGASVGCSA